MMRVFWSAVVGLLLSGLPALAAASPPMTACAMGEKADVGAVSCMTCCLMPVASPAVSPAPRVVAALIPAATAPMTGVEPRATSPPPRSVRV